MTTNQIRIFYQKYRYPILITIAMRIFISLWMMFIGFTIENYYLDNSLMKGALWGHLKPQTTLIGRTLLDIWLHWDAVHYMNIAVQGYSGVSVGDYNFAPLYPYLTLYLKQLTFSNVIIAGLLISTLSTMVAFVLLYKLVYELFSDEKLAKSTILMYSLYPTSFFLFAPYTDGLFLCLTVSFFLFLVKRHWISAGVLVSLASITRIQGLLLILPLGFVVLKDLFYFHKKMNLRIVSGLLIAPIGFILFSVWRANQNISSLLGSFDQYSQIIFVTPLTGIFLAIRQFLETGSLLVLGELLSLLLFGAILGWMIGQKRFQIYPSMLIYSVGLVVLFLSKHSYSASAMQSSARYVLAIFPAFIGIGHLVDHLSSRYQKLVKLSSFFLLLLVSAIYGFGFFVG